MINVTPAGTDEMNNVLSTEIEIKVGLRKQYHTVINKNINTIVRIKCKLLQPQDNHPQNLSSLSTVK